jgi:hypothetical protein
MKRLFVCITLLALAGTGYSQTARDMDALLETRILTYGQAVQFAFSAAEILDAAVSAEDAFAEALKRGWIPASSGLMYPVKYDKAAFLLMKAFDLKGGLFYRLFPGPRYAYRELVYRRIIQGPVDSFTTLTGEEFLNILGRILELRENRAAQNGGGSNE